MAVCKKSAKNNYVLPPGTKQLPSQRHCPFPHFLFSHKLFKTNSVLLFVAYLALLTILCFLQGSLSQQFSYGKDHYRPDCQSPFK